MKFLETACLIIHIRVSSIKILSVSLRTLITVLLTGFVLHSGVEIYQSFVNGLGFLDFLKSSMYMLVALYVTLYWVKSWRKANKMLNKALDSYDRYETSMNKNKK